MTRFEVTILGANSAIPTANRFPTSQLLNVNESYYLIDCGEGTQIQLRRNKLKFQRIETIFISHLHGDHYFGLIGLLTTMHLLKREKPLKIIAPESLQEIISIQLRAGGTLLGYSIEYVPLVFENGYEIFKDEKISVKVLKLSHRIDCAGFVFEELEKPRNLQKDNIDKYNLTFEEIKNLKASIPIIRDKKELLEELLEEKEITRTYAYVTDTKALESIIPFIESVDLLYHESTFLKNETKRAKATFHSTTHQAANIALKAKVKKLMLGHYSTRYLDLEILLEEAKEVFENSILAIEGNTIKV